MRVKILVAYHRPAEIVRDEVYTPVLAGAAVRTAPTKEGGNHLDDGFLTQLAFTDEQGENVSSLNRRINEMSVIYWAWKNYALLGDPDFVGFAHYRRFFVQNEELELPKEKWLRNSEIYVYSDPEKFRAAIDSVLIGNALSGDQVLVPHRYAASQIVENSALKCCKDRFVQLMYGKKGELYDAMERLVLESRPDFRAEIEYMRTHTDHYVCNMFVMPKALFFDYCSFLFPILFKLVELDHTETDVDLMRAPGFLSEFLTSLYLASLVREGKIPVRRMKIACWGVRLHGPLRRFVGGLVPVRFRRQLKRLLGVRG